MVIHMTFYKTQNKAVLTVDMVLFLSPITDTRSHVILSGKINADCGWVEETKEK